MIPEFYYADFPRQFRLRKRERSSSYVTDDEDENGRKGHVRKERNYSKTASNYNHQVRFSESDLFFSLVMVPHQSSDFLQVFRSFLNLTTSQFEFYQRISATFKVKNSIRFKVITIMVV